MIPAMEIRGRQLHLRLPVPEDAGPLLRHASDPQVTHWLSWGPYLTIEEPRRWIARQQERREAGVQLDFVIHHNQLGPVGVTGLAEFSPRDRRAMVGTWLGRELWGTGANSEAKALLARFAFDVCGFERLGAYANPANGRSVTALERIGFRREGTLRHWHRHGDNQLDVHIFGLLREDWPSTPLAAVAATVVGAPPAPWLLQAPTAASV
jgi:ribosomal-protein-alanine N-acetyltransferase